MHHVYYDIVQVVYTVYIRMFSMSYICVVYWDQVLYQYVQYVKKTG